MDKQTKIIGKLSWEISSEITINELNAFVKKFLKLGKAFDKKIVKKFGTSKNITLDGIFKTISEKNKGSNNIEIHGQIQILHDEYN